MHMRAQTTWLKSLLDHLRGLFGGVSTDTGGTLDPDD